MPSPGLLNGAKYSNIETKISSRRSITTNNFLQKNIRSTNIDIEAARGLFQTFNINSVSVITNPTGTSMVGNFIINSDRCVIRYTGFAYCQQDIVTMEIRWEKTPNNSYYATLYIVDNVNDQQLRFVGIYRYVLVL